MSKTNKIIIAAVVVVVLVLAWWYWMGSSLSYAPTQNDRQTPVQSTSISVSNNEKLGSFLVGPSGMTLYFKKGDLNKSTCYGQCAVNWPPLVDSAMIAGAGTYKAIGTISRTDGIEQTTYGGKLLYYWVNDLKPGDTTGDGVGGIWSVAKP